MAIKSFNLAQLFARFRSIFATTLLCAIGGFTGVAHAGYAAIVVDPATGQVLNAVNADEQNYPASLVKMMTLYLTFQELNSGKITLDQQLSVSAHAANKSPTKLGLRPGETISVHDCILGMVTKSANDAATVAAEGLGGTEQHFAEMMTAQAQLLGMTHTHFDNATGLPDPDNTTTARDMAKLAMALYRDFPQYKDFFATREFMFRGRLVQGHNHLMDRYPGMDGLKTGFTDASGFNLASTAVVNGHRLFGVVMGGRTAVVRDNLMARLLDDGFDHRQTPAILVAQAGVAGPSLTHRVLAALSPIGTAEADTPRAPLHRLRHNKHLVAVNTVASACPARKGVPCSHRKQVLHSGHGGSATRLARARRTTSKKPVVVASSLHDGHG